jgi:hypothetical protein
LIVILVTHVYILSYDKNKKIEIKILKSISSIIDHYTNNLKMSQEMNNEFAVKLNERNDENYNDNAFLEQSLPEDAVEEEVEEEVITVKIFRFQFTEAFMADLNKFAKIHQYDHRKDFKEAWINWTEENDDIIQEEVDRLNNIGYDGDILDKMFKSARYYFRKKSPIKADPQTRRQYISVNHDLLAAMDTHIRAIIRTNEFQPKNGFVSFCLNNDQLVKATITQIFNQGINDGELIQKKLKKTYKNRYFMLISK